MPEAVPIRDDVVSALDVGREMVQYVAEQMNAYVAEHGEPLAIAFVLVGRDRIGAQSVACSWAPSDDQSTRLHTCAVASAVLMQRALGL